MKTLIKNNFEWFIVIVGTKMIGSHKELLTLGEIK
jgi:hypothetical protein